VYDFVRGPMLWAAMFIFLSGLTYRLIRYYRFGAGIIAKGVTSPAGLHNGHASRRQMTLRQRALLKWSLLKASPLAAHPLLTVVSVLFHVLIFLVPMLLLAHNILLHESWGIRLYSLRESTTDILTLFVLGCCLFFLFRRLLDKHARSISSRSDYAVLALVGLPFITGFLAYHQLFQYRAMVIAHMVLAEILIALIPFSKLMHMIFFFANRLLSFTDYSYSRTRRIF
jgi:nitrate reductase gamma subunit